MNARFPAYTLQQGGFLLRPVLIVLTVFMVTLLVQSCGVLFPSSDKKDADLSLRTAGTHYVPTMPIPEGESHWLETEYPVLFDGPMQSGADSDASNGAFIWVPYQDQEDGGSAAYQFDINEPGDYVIWGRVFGLNGNSDSFYVCINEGESNEVEKFAWWFSSAGTWHWEKIHLPDDPDSAFYFQSGLQRIVVSSREKGAQLDKILITQDSNYCPTFAQVLEVDNVWSGHRVGFELITGYEYQYAAYYDENRQMTIAAREFGSSQWTYQKLDSFLGWDSHNYVALALDMNDQLHLSGNMHNDPLVYFRTQEAGNISRLARFSRMVGTQETSVTYPKFFKYNSELVFHYRQGTSGNGQNFFNIYNESQKNWQRFFNNPLFDGTAQGHQGTHNAYYIEPFKDAHDIYHVLWVWRANSDAATCHNLSHAQTSDFINWEDSQGQPIELPITVATGEIIDPVPVGGGLLNTSFYKGFDSQNRLVVTYHKYDETGNSQIYNARLEGNLWQIYRMSDWNGRWDFGGGGSLPGGIPGQGGVRVEKDGTLTQAYTGFESSGIWLLDEDTMSVIGNYIRKDPVWIPGVLSSIETHCPECIDHDEQMKAMYTYSKYQDSENTPEDFQYFIKWETLGANRDLPRDYIPPPSILRLYTTMPFYKGEEAENLP